MDPFRTQQQIRQNATELSDYLSDLRSWGNEMEKKEKLSKQNKNDNKEQNNDDLPPIRNSKEATDQIKRNV